MESVRFTRGSRKHRIGKASAIHVMETAQPRYVEPEAVPGRPRPDIRVVWIGNDERGRELEIVAVQLSDYLLVIHVMPTALRRRHR